MKRYLLVFLYLLCSSTMAVAEFKIITLQHRFASDLLPTISPMVGEDGTATGVNNQLILRASPARMREIEQVIAQLDAARTNRKITVRRDSKTLSQRDRTEASGKIKVGNVTVGNDKHALPNSGRIDIERSNSRTNQNSDQFITVIDGERAFIKSGQIVPFTEEWISITKHYVNTGSYTSWREISTGFAVRPRTVGNQVELEITPRIASLNGEGFIDFEELSTTIRTSLGTWVDIGGTMQNNDDVSRKILGLLRTSSKHNSSLQVRVD